MSLFRKSSKTSHRANGGGSVPLKSGPAKWRGCGWGKTCLAPSHDVFARAAPTCGGHPCGARQVGHLNGVVRPVLGVKVEVERGRGLKLCPHWRCHREDR